MQHSSISVSETAVVLVHGTKLTPRSGAWTDENSNYLRALETEIQPLPIYRFVWSGGNSNRARIEAASQLMAYCIDLCSSRGHKKFWFIAHSHGGNVVCYASRHMKFRDLSAGIIFYGTPFINIYPRHLDRFTNLITQTLSWILAFALIPPVVIASQMIAENISATYGTVAIFVFSPAILALYISFRPLLRRKFDNLILSKLLAWQRQAILRLMQPAPSCPCFVFVAKRDEANILLNLLDTLAVAPWQALMSCSRIIFAIMAADLLLGGYFQSVDETIGKLEIDMPIFMAALAIGLFVIVSPPFLLALVNLIRGHGFAFGWEGIDTVTLRARPSRFPNWGDKAEIAYSQTRSRSNYRGLRHASFFKSSAVLSRTSQIINHEAASKCQSEFFNTMTPEKYSTRNRNILHQWVVPASAAATAALVYMHLYNQKMAILSNVKQDFPSGYDPSKFPVPPTKGFRIDHVFKKKPGSFDHAGVEDVSTPSMVPARSQCLLEGNFKGSNWDTSLAIALYQPNSDIIDRTKIQRSSVVTDSNTVELKNYIYEKEIWTWTTSKGKEVTFARYFQNTSATENILVFRVWQGGETPAPVTGEAYIGCHSTDEDGNG